MIWTNCYKNIINPFETEHWGLRSQSTLSLNALMTIVFPLKMLLFLPTKAMKNNANGALKGLSKIFHGLFYLFPLNINKCLTQYWFFLTSFEDIKWYFNVRKLHISTKQWSFNIIKVQKWLIKLKGEYNSNITLTYTLYRWFL